MLDSARRRARWAAAISLTAVAGFFPAAVTTTSADAAAWGRSDACGSRLAKSTGGSWSCTFVDNFDGTAMDGKKWIPWDTKNTGYTVAGDCFMASSKHQSVADGSLRLSAHRESAPITCQSPPSLFAPTGSWTTEYTSSQVTTYKQFNQAYGRFEARIKFPATTASGLHANFWMWPDQEKYGGWPNSGEIDVAEWFSGFPDKAYPSLRYAGWTDADTGQNCAVVMNGAFHTYAVEWTPTRMTFLYDGRACFTRSWLPTSPLLAPQPFDTPFHLILTQASNPGAWWNPVTDATPFPATTYVDYVKVWK